MATTLANPPPSGQLLYERRCVVTVAPPVLGSFKTVKTQTALVVGAGAVHENLRIKFKVAKTLRKEPNPGEVTIWNLNPTHRAMLDGKGSRLWLQAGYPGTVDEIYSGDVVRIDHKKTEKDWESRFELGDGARAYAKARAKASFKGGTTRADVLKSVASQSGFDLGNVASVYPDLADQLVNGYAYSGPAAAAITELLAERGFTWSVQNGAIQVLPLKGYVPGTAVVVDVEHGLIGSPEAGTATKKNGPKTLKVKILLQPQIVPGMRIQLTSKVKNGTFAVQRVEHSGDTFGTDFYTEMECIPV